MSLRRALGPVQVQLISLGGIIGSGYFLGLGSTLAENGAWSLLAYALGGLIVWLVAMAMGEVSIGMPREGSFVSHATELIGRPWAAGVGWSYWFNWCAYIPAEMIAGGLILNKHFPQAPVIVWAVFFGACITAVNTLQVGVFGKIESVLSVLKIGAILGFVAVALCVWMGLLGTPLPAETAAVLAKKEWAPPGMTLVSMLAMMVLVLVNYQGTEIIALTAAEAKNPIRAIPRASRNVAIRTLLLYLVPIAALLLIYPWQGAKGDRSAFAEALTQHGLPALGTGLEWIILSAALSCANSGLYGAVRAMYGLAKEGLAPAGLGVLSDQGVPRRATLLTIAMIWCFLPIYTLYEGSQFYTLLLSVSGFTGAICWISISITQVLYRRRVARTFGLGSAAEIGEEHTASGKHHASPQSTQRAGQEKTPRSSKGTASKATFGRFSGSLVLAYLSIFLQTICLILVVVHPTLRPTLVVGVPVFVIPMLVVWLRGRNRVGSERAHGALPGTQ